MTVRINRGELDKHISKASAEKRQITITFTPNAEVKVQGTKDFNVIEILDGLELLVNHFINVMEKDYVRETGDRKLTEGKMEAWMNKKRGK